MDKKQVKECVELIDSSSMTLQNKTRINNIIAWNATMSETLLKTQQSIENGVESEYLKELRAPKRHGN